MTLTTPDGKRRNKAKAGGNRRRSLRLQAKNTSDKSGGGLISFAASPSRENSPKKSQEKTAKKKKTSHASAVAPRVLKNRTLFSPPPKKALDLWHCEASILRERSIANNGIMAGSQDAEGPAAKNKRTADRQITKDDDEEVVGNGKAGEGFVKADAEVLKNRRIVKARRPVSSRADEEAPKSANPFANTVLVPSNSDNDKPKVFGSGSGFSGFGSAAATSSNGFGGTIYNGFGTAPSSTGFGFGTAPTTTSTAEPGTSSAITSTPSFGFGKSSTTSTASANDSADKAEEVPVSPTKATLKLPDEVKLTNGEENEQILIELRVKVFKLVQSTAEEDKETSKHEVAVAAPSVPPSTSSFTKPKTEAEAASADDETKNKNADDSNLDGKLDNANSKGKLELKWQDLGAGPFKLLEGGPNKLRLVQRYQGKNPGDKPTRVLLNHPFWKESRIMKTDTKYLQLDLLVPTEDKTLEKMTYSIKFKSEAEADSLYEVLTKQKETAKSCFPTADHKAECSK
jgi:NUP50 (Nucleoporin 50 kDa)